MNGHSQETANEKLLEELRLADRALSDAGLALADFRRRRFTLVSGGLRYCAAVETASEDIAELHRLEAARNEAGVKFQRAMKQWAASQP